ncbi:MAG TPA: sucrase ferredoxin [Candidatus Limnocylindrales bacterium]|nr:sucrase ferredoxin [Candidatus Limnocylindrales bacterium]
MDVAAGPGGVRCRDASAAAGQPMAGTAPRADVWIAVEHPLGWGDAGLARSGHGVRILMARGPRANPVTDPTTTTGPVDTRPATGGPPGTSPGTVGPAGTQDPAGARVWVGYATGTPTLRVGRIDRPEDVAAWDLSAIAAGSLRGWGRAEADPLLLVCANGRRDRCCGHEGGRLAEALWRGPHRDRVLTCTHLGGHRFAPTALLLPAGALHGRLDEASASDLVARAHAGRTPTASLRGFSSLDEPAQVADAHARGITGYDTLSPLQVDLDPLRVDLGPSQVDLDPLRADLGPDRDPDRMGATVRGWDPRDPDRSLAVGLVRTGGSALMACGRDPEATTRWLPAP